MIVTLIKKERTYTLYLPRAVKGQFWVSDKNSKGQTRKLLSIEGISGKWYIRSYRSVQITDVNGKGARLMEMSSSGFYRVSISPSEEPALLFCEEITEGRLNFKKYMIDTNDGIGITIGRNSNNSIAFDNMFVSGTHCTLMYHMGRWTIQDNKSGNGTFVNNYSVTQSSIKPGDSIYILGLTIIIGSNFIAVNNPKNNVVLNPRIFMEYVPQKMDKSRTDSSDQQDHEIDYFYRTPRFKREIETYKYEVDAPPQSPIHEVMPLLITLGPSLTMGMMAVTTGGFAIMNAFNAGNRMMAIPAIVMSLSMLLGAILWPTLARRYQRRKAQDDEAVRQSKYREYLGHVEYQIQAELSKQETILRENFLPVAESIKRVATRDISLWERNFSQNDFLRLRVGMGDDEPLADIRVPDDKFTLVDDNLVNEVQMLGNKPKKLRNVPITTSLYDNYFTSVIGDRKKCIDFANGLIIQLTAYYGYDDVKTVFIYDEIEKSEFGYAKWLPHAWSDDKKLRMIATNMNELKEVSAHLEKEIVIRRGTEENSKGNPDVMPYYVIFVFSLDLALRSELLKQIYSMDENINISIISFFDELKNVPKEATSVIELKGHNGKIFDKNDTSGMSVVFTNDIANTYDMATYSVNMANIFLDMSSSSFQLPKMVTFMDMFGVSKVDHLNATMRWKENDPTATLQAPIGINTFGDLFYLDLHEKFHGPHGLVAGTTGSGKSEFIITYILSLALNYHPHEVAFILIDYKGGGMAKAFEHLPHTAGIITNLDGSAIKRSLVSINSELKHRQAVFNDASKLLGTRVADIYAYQKEYRNGKVKDPIPHLFIISDEFAELKSQQQEFMAELVSTARIGRSLGVHLILATQKPDGVVDDQIWSNSKFKISLKVQDRADSMSMIKRPDASELVDTGRFYLLVGNNEVFELGQSAWAGADYAPAETVVTRNTVSIDVIDINGRVIQSVKPDAKAVKTADNKKQLDAISDYITQTAIEENVFTRQLWLAPIEPIILLENLHRLYPQARSAPHVLNPLIGEVDDPAKQRRFPLNLALTDDGNTVIYGSAGGGKATFITTMVYDLICAHSVEYLNLYLLDFGAETLRAFKNAPQVGDVVFSDESEKIRNLFKMLRKEVSARKKLFSDWGGDHSSYCERSGTVVPNIVVVMNNYTNFRELYSDYEDDVTSITQECAKYGIYFIFTTTSVTGMSYRVTQNCGKFFALQLNDEMDYASIVGRTEGLYPAKFKGRGLVNMDEVYEFQIAHVSDPVDITDDIRKLCDTLAEMSQGMQAKRIPILPDVLNPEFFAGTEIALRRFPIAINKTKLNTVYLDLATNFITAIVANDATAYAPFAQGIAELLSVNMNIDTTVLDADSLFIPDNSRRYRYMNQDMEPVVLEIADLAGARSRAYKNEGVRDFSPVVYIIPSLMNFSSQLSVDAANELEILMERCTSAIGIRIIVCDALSAMSTFASRTWFSKNCAGDGVWVGDGVSNQFTLKINNTTSDLYGEIGNDFGVIIKKGKYEVGKLLKSHMAVNEEDDDG